MNACIPTPTASEHRGPVHHTHHKSVTSVMFETCESEALGTVCDRAVNTRCGFAALTKGHLLNFILEFPYLL